MSDPVVCWNCYHGHHDRCHRVVILWTEFPDYIGETHDCDCPYCTEGRL